LITAVKEEINGWTETVYYFLAHPGIVKFRELRAGNAKSQLLKPVETPKRCQTETASEIEPQIEQKTPKNSYLEIDQECHAADRQNVGNLSDHTVDRLYINTPPYPTIQNQFKTARSLPPGQKSERVLFRKTS